MQVGEELLSTELMRAATLPGNPTPRGCRTVPRHNDLALPVLSSPNSSGLVLPPDIALPLMQPAREPEKPLRSVPGAIPLLPSIARDRDDSRSPMAGPDQQTGCSPVLEPVSDGEG